MLAGECKITSELYCSSFNYLHNPFAKPLNQTEIFNPPTNHSFKGPKSNLKLACKKLHTSVLYAHKLQPLSIEYGND